MIDLWDLNTLPSATLSLLNNNTNLIRQFFERQAAIKEISDTAGLRDTIPTTEFYSDMYDLKKAVEQSIMSESIRGFHYTRLTDPEVRAFQSNGISVTSLAMFRSKLAAVVSAGLMTQKESEHVFTNSPIVTGEYGNRIGTFFACGCPYVIGDPGISGFHSSWGGEISRWAVIDEAVLQSLRVIGKPRIIEVEIPVALTAACNWVPPRIADQIVAVKWHAPKLPSQFGVDLCIKDPLPAANVLRIHTDGEPDFAIMARGYPDTYVEPIDEDED
jgi:hypothetical protein